MATPTLTCPHCRKPLEYHVTIEMLNPPIGKIDTGYCERCERLFERIRETDTFYDSTLWPPLCRSCRQPVTFASLASGPEEGSVVFQCRAHAAEQWLWAPGTERWKRRS